MPHAYPQINTDDTIIEACVIQKNIRQLGHTLYNDYFQFVNYNSNCIEYADNELFKRFLQSLANSKNEKIRILHIGDSHVQADFFTGYVRRSLQVAFGNGGRGLIFPYKAAATHASIDYKTNVTGNWTSAKVTDKNPTYPIGISGISAHTDDINATATIIFNPNLTSIANDTLNIIVLYKPSEFSFNLKISSGTEVWIKDNKNKKASVLSGKLKCETDTIQLSFFQSDTLQNFFEIYGILIESTNSSGIVYHNAGINGAALKDFQNQELIEEHLKAIQADLIIIDLGTNDIAAGSFDELALKQVVNDMISRIKATAPNTPIMLLTPQDMYRKKKHISSPQKFSNFFRAIAEENGCLFYDFFNISGGQHSMLLWEKNSLAKKDRVHLTKQGYELKGQLFVNALLQQFIAKEINNNEMICSSDTCLKYLFSDILLFRKTHENDKKFQTQHIVQKGESLSLIASKYKVSVQNIKEWNNLKSTVIYAGQQLIVQTESVNDNKHDTIAEPKFIIHIVKKGNTLSGIAKQYGVSVAKIKEWNNLKTDVLQINAKLKILQ